MASQASGDLASKAKNVAGIQVLTQQIEGANAKTLRELADSLKSKLDNSVFLLAAAETDKVSLIAGVTKDLTSRYKAGDLMRLVAPMVGGKGGGRPDMAQGGGTNPDGINGAFDAAESWVSENA